MSLLKVITVALAVVSATTAWAKESREAEGSRQGGMTDLRSTWSFPDRDADHLIFAWSHPDESRDLLLTWWKPTDDAPLLFAFSSPEASTDLVFTWSRPDESRDLLFTWSRPLPEAEAEGSAGGEPSTR